MRSLLWNPPKIWEGSTAFIIGGGPSVNQVDLSLIYDRHVIGVNNSYLLGSWVDVCWWGDMTWLDWHKKRLRNEYKGLIVSCNENSKVIEANHHWIKFLGRSRRVLGIETVPKFISWNKNSGCSAINLAVKFGAKTIVLLGFDMQQGAKGETHWHKGHHEASKAKKNDSPYVRFRKTTTFIARDAMKLKITILNASPITTINAFDRVNLEDVL